jgi:hypothetical protein
MPALRVANKAMVSSPGVASSWGAYPRQHTTCPVGASGRDREVKSCSTTVRTELFTLRPPM